MAGRNAGQERAVVLDASQFAPEELYRFWRGETLGLRFLEEQHPAGGTASKQKKGVWAWLWGKVKQWAGCC